MALTLSTQSFESVVVPAAPPGSGPSFIAFALISSGGPFCIVGFYINAFTSDESPGGVVEITLERINGSGVDHPTMQLADGFTRNPQDLVISYGSVMSSSRSLSFEVRQSPSESGTGATFNIEFTVVYFADESVTLAVLNEEP